MHLFKLDAVLPRARHEPAGHAAHDEIEVNEIPPVLHVPTGHNVDGVAEPVPAGQYLPAGHGVPVGDAAFAAHQ